MKEVPQTRNKTIATLRLMRPRQWVKNSFVLAGVFFGGRWMHSTELITALWATLAFCLASSTVYAFNDAFDAQLDRLHPRKRHRPVASGELSVTFAVSLAIVLATCASALAWKVGGSFPVFMGLYLTVNLAYGRWLRSVMLLDVFCIASGFSFRLLAGTSGLEIPPSQWFLLCAFFLSLFLGFSKRYSEQSSPDAAQRRQTLGEYSPEYLRILLGITAACSLMAYGLYTVSDRTTLVHGTQSLAYTLPFCALALFRYLHLVMTRGFGEDTAAEVIKDSFLFLAVCGWVLVTGWVLLEGKH
jgi:4-hydroxybenzoate polyprenyltransferase